jgi:hypothetical protein
VISNSRGQPDSLIEILFNISIALDVDLINSESDITSSAVGAA